MFLEGPSWTLLRRLFLEGSKHAAEVATDRGHGRMGGAEGRLADGQRPLQLVLGFL